MPDNLAEGPGVASVAIDYRGRTVSVDRFVNDERITLVVRAPMKPTVELTFGRDQYGPVLDAIAREWGESESERYRRIARLADAMAEEIERRDAHLNYR